MRQIISMSLPLKKIIFPLAFCKNMTKIMLATNKNHKSRDNSRVALQLNFISWLTLTYC
jgi:hypothetical protein